MPSGCFADAGRLRHGARWDRAGLTATLQTQYGYDDPEIHRLKQTAADLVDLDQAIPSSLDCEVKCLVALAQTAVESARCGL
jgi:hypothetical protein